MRIISANKPRVEDYSNFSLSDLKDKAKGLVGGGKLKGLADNFLNKNKATEQPIQQPIAKQKPTKPKGMSKGLKIGLIIGGSLLLVGLTVLVIVKTRKK